MVIKPTTAVILETVNLELVQQALRSVELMEHEYDDLADRVLLAADLWLAEDIESEVLLCEHAFDYMIKGVFDIIRVKNGKCKIIDWKTAKDVKRPNYSDEIREEFQSSFYLQFGGDYIERELGLPRPDLIEYRCIDEKEVVHTNKGEEYVAAPGHVVTVTKLSSELVFGDAQTQLQNVQDQYRSQNTAAAWTRNKPRACFTGGIKEPACPFWEDCCKMTMPFVQLLSQQLEEFIPRSKSAIKDFLHCPEQYRRLRVLGERDNFVKPKPVLKGEAFHAACASLWSQAFANKK